MLTYTKAEFELKSEIILNRVKTGQVFLHPTDTIYGIGCDATNEEAVKKIRAIKERFKLPFSVMVPSKTWIRDNCEINDRAIEWLKKLPGPYTLILKLKNKGAIVKQVNNNLDTVGVRIPDHWIHKLSQKIDRPIVTTSANIVGNDFMTSLENLDISIRDRVDFTVYEGEKQGRPSTIIDLTKDPEEKKAR